MDAQARLIPSYTASQDRVGLSGCRPVRVSSWMDVPGPLREIRPGEPEYPGWKYGDTVYAPERQDHQPHDHAFYEICIVRRGVAVHRTDFTDDLLQAGTVVVMAPHITHAIYGEKDLWQTNIYYLAEWLSDDLAAYWRQSPFVPLFLAAALFRSPLRHPVPQFVLNGDELNAIDAELADLALECHEERPSQIYLKSGLIKLLIKLSRAYGRSHPEERVLGFREEVAIALEYIEQAILQCEAVRINELAKRCGLSPNHFAAVFRQATGWAPSGYYQRRRVQHACRLLLDGARSITDVAQELGYVDSAHLCHLFKQYKNICASEYRRQYSGDDRTSRRH